MSERINGTVSEWNGSEERPYGFIDVEGIDKFNGDVTQDKESILKVGAKVSFVYEPGTSEQAADDLRLRS